jgi:hypothetical protein
MVEMNIFTNQQQAQIRKELNVLMKCGTAHICLRDATPQEADPIWETTVQWFKVTANMPYDLFDSQTGKVVSDDKIYEISVGQYIMDRRRHLLTSLDLNQHKRFRAVGQMINEGE